MSADLPSPESSAGARGSANAEAEPRTACNGSRGLVGVGGVLPPVLDVCCGPRMFWFDKRDPRALFVDKRREEYEIAPDAAYPKGCKIVIAPDVQADFSALPFPDESFSMVVFDPPHIERVEALGIFTKKYGNLNGDWRAMLRGGFAECFRVLKPNGTLIFKWAESEYSLREVLALTPEKPLFGHQTRQHSKTHWCAFLKGGGGAEHGERNGAQRSGPSSPNVSSSAAAPGGKDADVR